MAVANLGGQYATLVNQYAQTSQLVGLVDLHTHPAAHLGFGTELFYGAPDGDPTRDFNNCNGFHGGPGLFNTEGNEIRRQVVDGIAGQEYAASWDHNRSGWPGFPAWPTWHDRLHQQVRVEMLQRAWQGGLRLIVALAVNSHTLAKMCQTAGRYDDQSAGDAQIAAIKEMVAGQSFMGLAQSPADVRQIIGNGKLAVVIGVELDCIGNFYTASDPGNSGAPYQPAPSDDQIRAEINRLFASGVRYFFPVHLTDNVFGGAALYEMAFNTATRYQFGSFFAPETAPASSEIGFTFSQGETFWGQVVDIQNILESVSLGFDPNNYPAPPPGPHRNSRGLQHQGQVALDELMRLGAMIDVDHMSEKTVLDTLQHTQAANYPLFAGHNAIRDHGGNERAHLIQVATQILNRGGMFGVGIKRGIPWLASTIAQLRNATPNGGIALGSDCSGLEQLPAPRNGSVVYSDAPNAPAGALQRCHLGNRAEDINTSGFSHIGMYPDFIEDGVSSGILTANAVRELLNAPERFVSAWETCLKTRSTLWHTMRRADGCRARSRRR